MGRLSPRETAGPFAVERGGLLDEVCRARVGLCLAEMHSLGLVVAVGGIAEGLVARLIGMPTCTDCALLGSVCKLVQGGHLR